MITLNARWFAAVLLLAVPAAVRNSVGEEPAPLSTARLLSSVTHVSPGVPFDAGLLISLSSGWHTYGSPAGDSGMPAELELELPDGWRAGPLQFPPAAKHTDAAGVTNVYYGRVLLPFTVTPSPDAAPGTWVSISGRALWLVCSDVCVPQSDTLKLRVRIAEAQPEMTDEWRRALSAGAGRAQTEGKEKERGEHAPASTTQTEDNR